MDNIYNKFFNYIELKDDKIHIFELLELKGIYKHDPRISVITSRIYKNKKKIYYSKDEG